MASFDRLLQGFVVVKAGNPGTIGAIGSLAITQQYLQKSMTANSGQSKTMQVFYRSLNGETGSVTSIYTEPKVMQNFVRNLHDNPAGAIALTQAYMKKTLNGVTGSIGGKTGQQQYIKSVKSGYIQVTGSTTKTILLYNRTLSGIQSTGQNPITISMHTEAQALTTYTNYPFNSFAKFNGVFIGASDTGLFTLSGDSDNGVPISASLRVGITDFGSEFLKRVDRMYVGYRTSGDLFLRVFTDEVNVNDYTLVSNGKNGLNVNRVLIGRGLAARYWQFEIQNRNGCDFSIDSMKVNTIPMKRKIGGM